MSIEIARKRKRKRAVALAAVATGRLPLRDALRDGHRGLGTCPVWRLLLTAPGLGSTGVRNTLERAKVWPLLTLDELTELQRQAILDELPRRIK